MIFQAPFVFLSTKSSLPRHQIIIESRQRLPLDVIASSLGELVGDKLVHLAAEDSSRHRDVGRG